VSGEDAWRDEFSWPGSLATEIDLGFDPNSGERKPYDFNSNGRRVSPAARLHLHRPFFEQ
jgi:hypothetical protein